MSNVRNGGSGGGLAFKSDFGVNSYVIKQLGVANTAKNEIRNYRQSTFPTLTFNNADKYEFLTTERSKTIAPGDFKSMFLTGTSPRRKDLPRVNTPSQSNVKSETKNDIHKKIIEIGENLHMSIINKLEKEYEQKVRIKENELKELYEKENKTLLETEIQKLRSKQETLRRDLKKQFDKQLQEKITEIKSFNENVYRQTFEADKIELKKTFDETMLKVKEEFEREKDVVREKAIESQARQHETDLNTLKSYYEHKIEKLNAEWKEKLNSSLLELQQKLAVQHEANIRKLTDKWQIEKETQLVEVNEQWHERFAQKSKEIEKSAAKFNQKCAEFEQLTNENNELKRTIDDIKLEYQKCIQRFSNMKKNETDFLF